LLVQAFRTRFEGGRAADKQAIKAHYNSAMKRLGLRHKLYTTMAKPTCEGASFNGVEVRKLIDDILKADGKTAEAMVGRRRGSILLHGLSRTAKALGDNGFIENMPRFAAFLLDWAKATLISLKMKPTVSERESFAELCRGYITKKRMVFDKPGGSWYDNMFMSVLPDLMRKYGTLGLYNQQSLEGAMRLRRAELKARQVTHRAGRTPGWAHELGREGTELLMEQRDAMAEPVNVWLMRKTLFSYRTHPPYTGHVSTGLRNSSPRAARFPSRTSRAITASTGSPRGLLRAWRLARS